MRNYTSRLGTQIHKSKILLCEETTTTKQPEETKPNTSSTRKQTNKKKGESNLIFFFYKLYLLPLQETAPLINQLPHSRASSVSQ